MVLVDRREDVLERRLAAERTAAVVDVLLELLAESVHVARDRHRRRVAERAEALAEDAVADVEQQVEVALLRAPVLERVEDLHHPPRADAARRALAARLVHIELRDTEAELHHAAAVVDRDDRARPEHRAGLRERVVVERWVDLGRGEDRRRRSAGDDRLELAPVGDAAAELVDELAQRRAVLELEVAAL